MLKPIKGKNKTEQIIQALKAHIVEGNLKSGSEFPAERELALKIDVSRFSLREALRVAEAQGLIEISKGRRSRVAPPSASAAAEVNSLSLRRSRNTLLDLVEARLVLETHIARVAAKKITAADIKGLEKTVHAIESSPDDISLLIAQNREFHNILVRAIGNIVFEIILAPLTELLWESPRNEFNYDTKCVVVEHGGIVAALKARRPNQTAWCMRCHLELTVRRQFRPRATRRLRHSSVRQRRNRRPGFQTRAHFLKYTAANPAERGSLPSLVQLLAIGSPFHLPTAGQQNAMPLRNGVLRLLAPLFDSSNEWP